MKISVFFKDYKLGELFQISNQIYYTSNIQGEDEFRENCFSAIFYSLYKSENKKIINLPHFIQDFIKMSKNQFMAKKANIDDKDDDFTKLFKLSTLNLDDIGFYIKAN